MSVGITELYEPRGPSLKEFLVCVVGEIRHTKATSIQSKNGQSDNCHKKGF